MTKVTVIIPSYNHAKFIGEAIQSVLHQTFQDYELLICDDGSSDHSVEVIKQFVDPRISLHINTTNMGACYSFNTMVRQAKGEYIALLNSDDCWLPEKLEKQVNFLDQHQQYGAVFSYAQVITEDGQDLNGPDHPYSSIFNQPNRTRIEWLRYFYLNGNGICHPSMLIRKSVYETVGLYNRFMASLPDFEMWIRVCAKYDIYIMPENLIKFRILNGERNASGCNPANQVRAYFELSKIYDAFCLIDDIDILNQVFPDININENKEIPIKLAITILKDNRIFAKAWALNKMYELLSRDSEYYSRFVSDVSFHKATASNDVFDVLGRNAAPVHLFYDRGVGYELLDSQPEINTISNEYLFDLSDHLYMKRLILNPINNPVIIKSVSADLILKNAQSVSLKLTKHNGIKLRSIIYFLHSNPQFIFNIPRKLRENIKAVKFRLDMDVYKRSVNPNSKDRLLAICTHLKHRNVEGILRKVKLSYGTWKRYFLGRIS